MEFQDPTKSQCQCHVICRGREKGGRERSVREWNNGHPRPRDVLICQWQKFAKIPAKIMHMGSGSPNHTAKFQTLIWSGEREREGWKREVFGWGWSVNEITTPRSPDNLRLRLRVPKKFQKKNWWGWRHGMVNHSTATLFSCKIQNSKSITSKKILYAWSIKSRRNKKRII